MVGDAFRLHCVPSGLVDVPVTQLGGEPTPLECLAVRNAVATALASPAVIGHSPLEEIRLSSWTHERAVSVGDAAHACAPVWAQGAALALEDAIVLAKCLSDGRPMPVALRTLNGGADLGCNTYER